VRRTTSFLPLLVILLSLPAVPAAAQEEQAAFAPVGRLLQSHCAMAGCHLGPDGSKGLRLESGEVYRTTVNVKAATDPRYLRVAPGAPERSLLYLKLLSPHQGNYRGPRMPLSMTPLEESDIALVRAWIASFPAETWGSPPAETAATPARPRSFQDSCLALLPTPDAQGRRILEFRFAHRFKTSAADAGSEGLYGLDSGAWISLELAYGLNDRLDLGLRRTNLDRDYEGYAKIALVRQTAGGSPLSLSFRGSFSEIRDPGRFNRDRVAAQAILARRFGDHLSLMLVPTYVTHTASLDPTETGGTAAVGGGLEWRFNARMALIAEYIGQTSGVKAPFQSASIGVGMATTRHVFQIVLTNVQGMLTDQYVPGGDLDAGHNEYRLGFNISRTHAFR